MPLYRHVGIAAAFSPRLSNLLAEAAYHTEHFAERLSVIHVGEATDENERRMREAITEAGLPEDTSVLWTAGSPADALMRTAEQHNIDLLIAGALERTGPFKYYLGSVAHDLVREAPCSLLLFTEPHTEPEPMRRIVFVADYSESALIALTKALRFAEQQTEIEAVHVLRVLSKYGEAMLLSEGVRHERAQEYQTHTLAEEKELLRDFVDAAGHTTVPVETHCIKGRSGYAAAQFVRERNADLLVMPSTDRHSHFFERLFPSDMEWVLREIPCNLWVAREQIA